MSHKAGFVNIIGNPNVGKSTLMNAFVGERLSIITSKAQTTRHRILGIVNGDDFQVILSDTPGIIKPAYEMQESMMNFVKSAFEDADILIYMVEIGEQDPKDQLTDKPERFFVNETIREKILLHYKKEIPYSVEIETEEFFEDENIIRIRALIMVERDTQKGIIIGHKGEALKRVGVEARADLEKFFGKQIHIEMYVKVNKNWRSNTNMLKRFGYNQN